MFTFVGVSSSLNKEESKQLTVCYRYLLFTPIVVSLSYEKDDNGKNIFCIGVVKISDATELPSTIIYETVDKWVNIPVKLIEEGKIVALNFDGQ